MDKEPNGKMPVLVVGQMSDWNKSGQDVRGDSDIVFSGFSDLSRDFLTNMRPELVLSNLFSAGFDAVDLAHKLCDLGYVGRYVALTGPLAHSALIKAEVERTCPDLEFDIVEIGAREDVQTR